MIGSSLFECEQTDSHRVSGDITLRKQQKLFLLHESQNQVSPSFSKYTCQQVTVDDRSISFNQCVLNSTIFWLHNFPTSHTYRSSRRYDGVLFQIQAGFHHCRPQKMFCVIPFCYFQLYRLSCTLTKCQLFVKLYQFWLSIIN